MVYEAIGPGGREALMMYVDGVGETALTAVNASAITRTVLSRGSTKLWTGTSE